MASKEILIKLLMENKDLKKKMAEMSSSVANATKKSTSSIQAFNQKLEVTAKKFNDVGRKAGLGFVAVGGAVIGLVKTFASLEKGVTNVLTLLDDKQVAQFGATIKSQVTSAVGQMGFAIDDANKAMFDTVSALGAGKVASDAFAQAQRLAIGGVAPLSIAVDGITSIMNAYGKEMTNATDVAGAFFTAQKFGKTTVADLASNIGKVAPIAKQAGIGYETLLAATSQLTLGGLSTEEATTALKGAISGLLKPADGAAKKLKAMGIPIGASEIKAKGFTFTLKKLAIAAKENPDALAEMIPNIRALTAIGSLGTAELTNMDEIIRSIQNDAILSGQGIDSLSSAVKKQQETTDFAMKRMAGSFKMASAAIGEALAPTIVKLSNFIADLSQKLSNLSPTTKKVIATVLLLATGILGLVSVFGFIGGAVLNGIMVISKLINVIKALNIVQGIFNALAMINPFTWIVIGVMAAIAAIVLLVKNWAKVVAYVKKTWASIKGIFGGKKKEKGAPAKKATTGGGGGGGSTPAPALDSGGGLGGGGGVSSTPTGGETIGGMTSTLVTMGVQVTGSESIDELKAKVKELEDGFTKLAESFTENVVTGIMEGTMELGIYFEEFTLGIQEMFLMNLFEPITLGMEEMASAMTEIFSQTIGQMLSPITTFVGSAIKAFAGMFKNFILQTLGFQKLFTLITQGLGLMWNLLANNMVTQWVIAMLTAAAATVAAALTMATAWAFTAAAAAFASAAAIPIIGWILGPLAYIATLAILLGGPVAALAGLAEGTPEVIGGANSDTVPAMLTPGEMVVPKSMAEGVRSGDVALGGEGGGTGGNTTNNVSVIMDGAVFNGEVDQEMAFGIGETIALGIENQLLAPFPT